ncbi:UNVERIFIED_CONTAM: SNF1-related protein kinase regulatory subunit gamma-like PV42a [Sesamum angustifolium]|uniref:SNF1-related protein kinase regulatory subunit gamma-like PV42a n=1 Tax=Sesamum angustifolium TaxID=2727405 RepID=A0AAW2LL30_9LAMI
MQATKMEEKTTEVRGGASIPQPQRLRDKKVKDLIHEKKRLVEVPYTASLADTMNALLANRVVAVPVAAPPGHWIGAGGSMILESDKQTGAARKHYIGMVTMLDVLAHIAGNDADPAEVEGGDLDKKMQVSVSSIIGHCLESLSLWTLNSNTSILDCMEVFSKGIHRALVPVDSHMENISGVELVESASSYRMVTQMDLLKFLNAHEHELRGILARPVRELGAVSDIVFGVTDKTKVIDAIRCMNRASLNAVPIVESTEDIEEDHGQLINWAVTLIKSGDVLISFSEGGRDIFRHRLRGCPIPLLQSCLQQNVMDFIHKLCGIALHEASGLRNSTKELITCHPESLLREVVDKVVKNHVHRVWVVNESGLLVGLISLTDIIRAARAWMLSEPA